MRTIMKLWISQPVIHSAKWSCWLEQRTTYVLFYIQALVMLIFFILPVGGGTCRSKASKCICFRTWGHFVCCPTDVAKAYCLSQRLSLFS